MASVALPTHWSDTFQTCQTRTGPPATLKDNLEEKGCRGGKVAVDTAGSKQPIVAVAAGAAVEEPASRR